MSGDQDVGAGVDLRPGNWFDADHVLEPEAERDDQSVGDGDRSAAWPLRNAAAAEHHVRVRFRADDVRQYLGAHGPKHSSIRRRQTAVVAVGPEIDVPVVGLTFAGGEVRTERHDHFEQDGNDQLAL